MEVNKEKIRYSLQFFFDKSKIAGQGAEFVHGVYGADTVTANYVQFWFRRFRSGIFDVKDAPCTGRSVIENVDKITKIIEVDRHVSSRSIVQELKKKCNSIFTACGCLGIIYCHTHNLLQVPIAELAERWTELPQVSDESRSFFRVHTGYFSNIPKCIKAEFIASWTCSQSSVVSSSKR
ncbi:histone-lysine N-methyltransferase SETMAR [Trichonephila clavipes]|nr:histone-lysine N-methyltransferase SETMAR [Trichonephila clavipes]